MQAQAPTHQPATQGPRNLAPYVADWLRKQQWSATEQEAPHVATVSAHWLGPRGERFELDYIWQDAGVHEATCRLRVLYVGQPLSEILFAAQRVRRLKDLRLVLTGNQRYYEARQAARSAHPPVSTLFT